MIREVTRRIITVAYAVTWQGCWYGLGPIAVAPARQGQSIGTQLMEHALVELRHRDTAGCVIAGDQAYYGRFGFRATPGLTLPNVDPYYVHARTFRGPVPAGTVS